MSDGRSIARRAKAADEPGSGPFDYATVREGRSCIQILRDVRLTAAVLPRDRTFAPPLSSPLRREFVGYSLRPLSSVLTTLTSSLHAPSRLDASTSHRKSEASPCVQRFIFPLRIIRIVVRESFGSTSACILCNIDDIYKRLITLISY